MSSTVTLRQRSDYSFDDTFEESMAVLVTAFSLLTDSLRDALDPKLK